MPATVFCSVGGFGKQSTVAAEVVALAQLSSFKCSANGKQNEPGKQKQIIIFRKKVYISKMTDDAKYAT